MAASAIRAVRSVVLFMLIGLGVVGCLDLAGLEDGTPANCPNNGFSCIHNLNTEGRTCVQVPDLPNSVTVVYACIMNGGDIRRIEPTIEDLSAWESSTIGDPPQSRQPCHDKTRCTR